MIASRRLINLAGTLLVAIALVAGTMLTALPIYLESRERNAQERDVAAANRLLQTQIDALRAKEAELPEVEQDLAELHGQFPGIPQLDDASQLVVKAAGKVDAAIESIQFDKFEPFAARDAAAVAEQLPQTATGVTPPDKADSSAKNGKGKNGDDSDDAATTNDATTKTDPGSSSAPAPPGSDSKLQFPVTITVIAPDQNAANRFLDELRAGPRLLRIDTVTASTEDDAPKLKLIVTGFVFVSLS